MQSVRIAVVLAVLIGFAAVLSAQEKPLKAISTDAVRITGGPLADRQRVNREVTVWAVFRQCEETGRIANFRRAAGIESGPHQGYFFNDSDVYKAIEGAAEILADKTEFARRAELDRYLDDLIAVIAKAQCPNGYIYTFHQLPHDGAPAAAPESERLKNLKDLHEMYCMGHLIEAGVAHARATGKTSLLDVAVRAADHLRSVFGPGKRHGCCGHEEIELALIKLGRHLGKKEYIDLARFFIEERGHAADRTLYGEYAQDDVPVRDRDEIAGHAVRATYLYCAATDLAAIDGDQELLDCVTRVYDDLTTKKMYVTGGIGTSAANEGFTKAFDLPNESAYAETCAGIGLCLWSKRMNLATHDARYIDVLERVLWNAVLSGVSLSGDRFFYDNPLASRGGHHRVPFFGCACCPPNVVRLIGSLGTSIFAAGDDALYVNLHASAAGEMRIGANEVTASLETDIPFGGAGVLRLRSGPDARYSLRVRVPEWAKDAVWQKDGKEVKPPVERGYARFEIAGAEAAIEFRFGVSPQAIFADPRVAADRGRVALAYGPLVFAFEGADNAAGVDRLMVPEAGDWSLVDVPGLSGLKGLRGKVARLKPIANPLALYRPAPGFTIEDVTAIPYFAWDNRTPGPMAVWMAASGSSVDHPAVESGIRATASATWTADTVNALTDGIEPENSADETIPRHTFWPKRGTTEWVALDFGRPRRVQAIEVYFFDDTGRGGGCGLPKAIRVLGKSGDAYLPVEVLKEDAPARDRWVKVRFKSIQTNELKIELDLREKLSAGILEVRVRP